ncbi:MAG: HypC/HybG/HupF family hydrogenase formation chaperone [Pirellulales bacterium]|nr:HypC/HybG/HupF family hydrogenase formation chaperone [Pirellulales bacterium]
MCLGVPGELLETYEKDDMPMGKVDFGGIAKEICLAYTPEAQVGQYVLVHVGFAISVIDQDEADEIVGYLEEIAQAGEEEERERLERLKRGEPEQEGQA